MTYYYKKPDGSLVQSAEKLEYELISQELYECELSILKAKFRDPDFAAVYDNLLELDDLDIPDGYIRIEQGTYEWDWLDTLGEDVLILDNGDFLVKEDSDELPGS